MGLDATVRCRCFEEGKLKPGPIPLDDVYIDEDGCLSSHKLDAAHRKYTYRQFDARYGDLERAFEKWKGSCCEHENGEYCAEWVGNWSGCEEFRELVEQSGGEAEFPLLSNLLPYDNGGEYPAEKAAATLVELDRFIEMAGGIEAWTLCDDESGAEICTLTGEGSFVWKMGPSDEVRMANGKLYFQHADNQTVATTHFRQIPLGDPDEHGCQRMRIVCLDTYATAEIPDSIGPQDADKTEREFRVITKKAPSLREGEFWTAGRIRKLLVASVETGNPIRWC